MAGLAIQIELLLASHALDIQSERKNQSGTPARTDQRTNVRPADVSLRAKDGGLAN
jgi:hypothetical protein